MIELRSDTFTLPTPAMLQAMHQAALGDDVYGEDPTVRRLEELAADRLGKAAACFMPSGTMANLAALMSHCPRGSKVLVGNETDIYIYEAGGASVCGGIMYEPIPTQADGRLLLSDLARAFPDDPSDPQFALPALICLENTHNRCGGVVLSQAYMREVAQFARERGVPVHLDGARLFNAAVALDVAPAAIAQYADSIQFCLSKGLGAPVGSMLVGDATFVATARRVRKMLGGGMRQAGLLAAAGIVALEQMAERLDEDHAHARRMAHGLAQLPGIAIDMDSVQTNIVLFRVVDQRFSWQTFIETLLKHGVALSELGYGRIRATFHHGITTQHVDRALDRIAYALRYGPA